MRRPYVAIGVLTAALLAPSGAVAQGGAVEVEFGGRVIAVERIGPRIEVLPLLQLLGAQAELSPAAGTYVIARDDHEIQIAPDRRFVLVDGALEEVDEPPVASPGGVAASPSFIDRVLLSPLGFHLERTATGYRIADGPRFARALPVRPAAADFAATTTLVLTLDREEPADVATDPEAPVVRIRFADASPRLDGSVPLRSRRIRGLAVRGQELSVELPPDVTLLSWHRLPEPPRIILEVGRRPPTPTPAPVAVEHNRSVPLVVVDPGHGGDDAGAVAGDGLEEKTVVLAVARRLARVLGARGYEVRLTRGGDETRALSDRTALANRLQATAFISLHANASRAASARGAETYYMSLDEGSDAQAAATAKVENAPAAGGHNGSDLDLILWDMAQAEVLNESAHLALDVQRRLNGLADLPDRGVKQAPFVVLRGATMPAVLVEVGFLSNSREARRLADPGSQQKLAEAVANGVVDFLRSQR